MAKVTDERRKEVELAIANHLNLEGPAKWGEFQKKHPDISRATLFRWVEEVRNKMLNQAVGQSPGALKIAQKRIKAMNEPLERVQRKISGQIPAAPSPAIIAENGAAGVVSINFMGRLEDIWKDAEMLRAHAVGVNEDGTPRLKNPNLLEMSMRRREALLETYLHALQEVYSLERMQQFYGMIIEEIGKADPDLQRTILDRLRALNSKHGLTIEARIG